MLANIGYERATLSGILKFGQEAFVDVADLITAQSFVNDSNQLIYKCVEKLFERDPNATPDVPCLLSLASELGFGNLLEKKAEREHLRALFNFPVERGNVRKYAGALKKLEVARGLVFRLESARNSLDGLSGDEKLSEILALAENPILEYTQGLDEADSEPVLVGDGIQEYIQYLLDNPRQQAGIPTGFRRYDETLGGGLRFGAVMVVAARMKVGKSMFGTNVGLHIAKNLGIPVLNIDTEMDLRGHRHRLLAMLSGVSDRLIETGKFQSKQREVKGAGEILQKIPYTYKNVISQPFEEILALMRRWVHRKVGLGKPAVIIYDYIKVMDRAEISKNLAEYQLLGFQLTALNDFMRKYNVACLCLAQTNRENLQRSDSGVVGGSDRIAQYCSGLHLLEEKDDAEMAEMAGAVPQYNMKLIPVLERYGDKLAYGDYINVYLDKKGRTGRMLEGPTRNEHNKLADTGFPIEDSNGVVAA